MASLPVLPFAFEFEIPFRREFAGTVTIAAYAPSETDDEAEAAQHTRTVLFPHDRDLKLDLSLDQESYRPGQNALAKFLARSATGQSAESALGVVILDNAVEERARTDRDVGGSNFYGPYRYLSNDFGAIGGVKTWHAHLARDSQARRPCHFWLRVAVGQLLEKTLGHFSAHGAAERRHFGCDSPGS